MGPEPIEGHPTAGTHIWGWMTPDELEWLRATAATMTSVVEIGVLRGRSAFALLTGCPGPVYCIDPWDDQGDHAYPAFMADCGHFPNLVAIRGRSPEAAAQVPDVDMVFIDGAHDYAQVVADITAWLPKTRRLICGHDYSLSAEAGFPDVRRAVDEIFGDRVRPADFVDTDFDRFSIWAVDV